MGVPQGSCSGPHLFSLSIAPIEEFLQGLATKINNPIKQFLFADDITLLVDSSWPSTVNSILAELSAFLHDSIGLALNLEKCLCMPLFSSSIDQSTLSIPVVNKLRLLGVTLTNDMTFTSHLALLEKDLMRRGVQLQKISRLQSGIPIRVTMNATKTYLLGKLDYGLNAICPFLSKKEMAKLDTIESKALKKA